MVILSKDRNLIIADSRKYAFYYDYLKCEFKYALYARPIYAQKGDAFILGLWVDVEKCQKALFDLFQAMQEKTYHEVK